MSERRFTPLLRTVSLRVAHLERFVVRPGEAGDCGRPPPSPSFWAMAAAPAGAVADDYGQSPVGPLLGASGGRDEAPGELCEMFPVCSASQEQECSCSVGSGRTLRVFVVVFVGSRVAN